ncbi:hypothetical protein ACWENA_01885 [Streptomyces sp. NPDC004779]
MDGLQKETAQDAMEPALTHFWKAPTNKQRGGRRGTAAAAFLVLPWAAIGCAETAPRPDEKPVATATATPSPANKFGWTHDSKYRDVEKGVEAALEAAHGPRWRQDVADIAVYDALVMVFTTWKPSSEARRQGIALCRTIASHIDKPAHKEHFPQGTEIKIQTEKSDSTDIMAYLDVTENKCKATSIFIG